ncbi:MAG: hypothetical protein GY753_13660, partial [Gammaproteobacteria bacterium]|nr:hypothetical protein [Gammaproteobacteria bacterium]
MLGSWAFLLLQNYRLIQDVSHRGVRWDAEEFGQVAQSVSLSSAGKAGTLHQGPGGVRLGSDIELEHQVASLGLDGLKGGRLLLVGLPDFASIVEKGPHVAEPDQGLG